jgi:hypothetical protein
MIFFALERKLSGACLSSEPPTECAQAHAKEAGLLECPCALSATCVAAQDCPCSLPGSVAGKVCDVMCGIVVCCQARPSRAMPALRRSCIANGGRSGLVFCVKCRVCGTRFSHAGSDAQNICRAAGVVLQTRPEECAGTSCFA